MSARTVILLLATLGATAGLRAADDPLMGAWKLNLAQSKYNPGPPPKSSTIRRTPVPNGLHYTNDGVDAGGNAFHTEYTAYFDGKDHPIAGDPGRGSIALTRINSHTVETVNRKDGKVTATGRWVISPDGKAMTMTIRGTTPQDPARTDILVYDKQ